MLPTQDEVLAFKSVYGDPRSRVAGQPSIQWESANLVRLPFPFRMTYAGQPIGSMKIHKACAPDFALLFDLLKDAAKGKQATLDQWGVSIFGGSYNFRLMRGGSLLSMHSFGCAIDLDPARNGLGDATPRFAEFPEVVKAFRDSGLCWGGDWNGNGNRSDQTRHDGMHLQATAPIGAKVAVPSRAATPAKPIINVAPAPGLSVSAAPASNGVGITISTSPAKPAERPAVVAPAVLPTTCTSAPSPAPYVAAKPGFWSRLFGRRA